MDQDYLWDKTGTDAEIERLENALQAFRYWETVPPAVLPARTISVQKERKRNIHRVIYGAVAACAAFLAISLTLLGRTSIDQTKFQADLAKIIAPSVSGEITLPDNFSSAALPGETVDKIKVSKQLSKPKYFSYRKVIAVTPPLNKTMANNRQAAKQTVVTLTKEEKYAYDQLMLALAITSSKLKMVKDKIAGLEEPAGIDENNSKF